MCRPVLLVLVSVHILCSSKYIPYEFVCPCVSQRGWPCRQEGLKAPFCPPIMGTTSVGMSTVLSAAASPIALQSFPQQRIS